MALASARLSRFLAILLATYGLPLPRPTSIEERRSLRSPKAPPRLLALAPLPLPTPPLAPAPLPPLLASKPSTSIASSVKPSCDRDPPPYPLPLPSSSMH
uniref:Putative secreted protein n=1 Tax=Anopheles darlingi TaxID=43151 RepID=A0A2M4D9V8_ANODA